MSVCDLLAPGPTFSPLTLFESTITNAQMLLESMAERELFSALRIVDSLHSRVVNVMEPHYSRACDRSDRLSELEAAKEAGGGGDGERSASPASSQHQHRHQHRHRHRPDVADSGLLGSALGSIKVEDSEFDDDDCVITEEVGDDDGGVGCYSGKLPRLDASDHGAGFGVCASPQAADVPVECKTIMRRAYKALKGAGPHLFDFSLPFSSETNQRVANLVMSKAKEMAVGKGWPDDVWQILPRQSKLNSVFWSYSNKIRYNYRCDKLSRRQKSFELVATSLSSDELEKFRVILTRDYTSSDEECGSGGSDQLRVRELPWESEEVKRLKRQLDDVYSENCATTKQRIQLAKSIRDPLRSRSQRPPPEGAPTWAVKTPRRGANS